MFTGVRTDRQRWLGRGTMGPGFLGSCFKPEPEASEGFWMMLEPRLERLSEWLARLDENPPGAL